MSLQKINWSQIDTDPYFGDVDLGTQENYLKNVFAENLFVSGITAGTINVNSSDILTKISGGTGISVTGGNTGITISNSNPDQTVTISGGTNIQITGTYPNFGVNFTGTTGSGGGTFTGGTVAGQTTFQAGLTATTISGGTFFGNGGSLSFTNTGATTIQVGGIAENTILTGKTFQEVWDLLLYPYEEPAFSSFSVSPTLPTFELGQSVTAGTKTYSWGIQDSQNLSAGTISIIEYTGTSQFRTISNGLTGTSKSITTTSPTFSSTTPTTQLIYTISAYDTRSNLFTRSINGNWRYRWYYGKYSGTTITPLEITGLTDTALVTSVVNNYITWDPTVNPEYGYLIIPTGLTQPTNLRNSTSGCQGSNIPYTTGGTVSFTNTYGVSTAYMIYKTDNQFAGQYNAWLCQ
jgi:hypothetical protein